MPDEYPSGMAEAFVDKWLADGSAVIEHQIRRATHEPIPADFPVQPLEEDEPAMDKATCGHCGLSWDDGKVTAYTPTPSARCPFEAFHIYPDEHDEN